MISQYFQVQKKRQGPISGSRRWYFTTEGTSFPNVHSLWKGEVASQGSIYQLKGINCFLSTTEVYTVLTKKGINRGYTLNRLLT